MKCRMLAIPFLRFSVSIMCKTQISCPPKIMIFWIFWRSLRQKRLLPCAGFINSNKKIWSQTQLISFDTISKISNTRIYSLIIATKIPGRKQAFHPSVSVAKTCAARTWPQHGWTQQLKNTALSISIDLSFYGSLMTIYFSELFLKTEKSPSFK